MKKKLFLALETEEEKAKRLRIEQALEDKGSTLKTWQKLALESHGLVNGEYYLNSKKQFI